MYKNILRSISDVETFPVVAILVFFLFFVGLLFWVLRMDKGHEKHMASLPLEDKEGGAIKKLWALVMLGFLPAFSYAQQSAEPVSETALVNLLITTMIVVALVCLMLTVTIFYLIKERKSQAGSCH